MSYANEHTLQDLLKRAYHRLEMDDTVCEIEVKDAYYKVVGDLISRLTWSVRFAEGTLTVTVASAALRQELTYRKDSLQAKINDTIGRNAVKKIMFF